MDRPAGPPAIAIVRRSHAGYARFGPALNIADAGAAPDAKSAPDFRRIFPVDFDGAVRRGRAFEFAFLVGAVARRAPVHDHAARTEREFERQGIGMGMAGNSSIGLELLKAQSGLNIVHVPYRGLPEAHTSVMRGDAMVFITFFSAGGDLIQANKLRPIGVTTAKRLAVLPDVPTLQEGGLAGYVYEPWFGLLAPTGTPKPVVDEINRSRFQIEVHQ